MLSSKFPAFWSVFAIAAFTLAAPAIGLTQALPERAPAGDDEILTTPAEREPEEIFQDQLAGEAPAPQAIGAEEIVVTARKREENLQDVPISITAFGAEQIQEMGLRNDDDVALMTVNFNTLAQLGRRLDRPIVRGMAAPETFGEPNASYFIDGVYLAGSISTYTLGPIERVEILRGPQSAQFGRATFSGAINYVTRQPTNEFTSELTTRVGEHDTRTLSGWASGPIIEDKLLYFVSGNYDQYGGEWNNQLLEGQAGNAESFINPPQWADNSDLGGTQTKQIGGKLLWIIDDTTELTLKAGYVRGDDDHYAQLIVETDELNCFVPGLDLSPSDPNYSTSPGAYCGKIDPDNRQNRLNLPDFRTGMTSVLSETVPNPFAPNKQPEDYISVPRTPGQTQDQYNYLLSLEKEIADWTSTSRAAYNKSELRAAYDLDGYQDRALTGQFGFYEEQDRDDYAFEQRIFSPGDKRLRGSLGVYYYHFEEDSANSASPGFTGLGQLTEPVESTTDNYALFGSIDVDISEQWSATTEARWARDKKQIDSPNACTDPSSPFFDPDNNLSEEAAKNSLTPRFTIRYQATEDAMIYVLAAKGNKPGDFNVGYYRQGRDACFAAAEFARGGVPYVSEETQWTYEAGTKTAWMDNRLTANLAAFYIDWDNQTFFETTPIPGEISPIPTSVGFNAGKSRIYGMELETSFAFSEKLTGTFAYGLADGEIEEGYSCSYANVSGIGLVPQAANPDVLGCAESVDQGLEINNLRGKTIPNSPKHSFVASLMYTDSITSALGWFARTDYAYENGQYSAANNFAEIGKRQTWNARSGLEADRWTATLYVNNMLDENTPSAIIGFPRFGETTPAGVPLQGYALSPTRGRIIGAELIVRFGVL